MHIAMDMQIRARPAAAARVATARAPERAPAGAAAEAGPANMVREGRGSLRPVSRGFGGPGRKRNGGLAAPVVFRPQSADQSMCSITASPNWLHLTSVAPSMRRAKS